MVTEEGEEGRGGGQRENRFIFVIFAANKI
jgi:hypothetical protein